MFLNHFITAKEFFLWLSCTEDINFLLILDNMVLPIPYGIKANDTFDAGRADMHTQEKKKEEEEKQ